MCKFCKNLSDRRVCEFCMKYLIIWFFIQKFELVILVLIILECLSHDFKHIGSQNPKLLTQVVHINPTLGLTASCWIDSTTFVSRFGFCDPICFKSWDRHSNMISNKINISGFWKKNNISYFIQNLPTVQLDIFFATFVHCDHEMHCIWCLS